MTDYSTIPTDASWPSVGSNLVHLTISMEQLVAWLSRVGLLVDDRLLERFVGGLGGLTFTLYGMPVCVALSEIRDDVLELVCEAESPPYHWIGQGPLVGQASGTVPYVAPIYLQGNASVPTGRDYWQDRSAASIQQAIDELTATLKDSGQ